MFRSSHFAARVAAIVLIATSFTFAFDYQESVSGDLPAVSTNLPTFTLDIGVNTISGNFSAAPDNKDSFAFVIPSGMSVTDGSVVVSDADGDVANTFWSLYKGTNNNLAAGATNLGFVIGFSPGSGTVPALPLSDGLYHFSHGGISFVDTGNVTANYTFSLTVVPEPASLSLIGLASCGLLVRKRR